VHLKNWTTVFVCLALFLISWAVPSAQRGAAGPITAIVGARLIDGTGGPAIENAVVIVTGDKITYAGPRAQARIPPNATTVDAAGKTLIPGLVDAHYHLNQPPEEMKRLFLVALHWGVTTFRVTGNDKREAVPLYHQVQKGEVLGPRVYTAGQGFSPNGPYPGAPVFRPKTPEEARANVQDLKAQGVDFVKLWMTPPKFSPPIVEAIVDEARKQGIPLVTHVTDQESLHQLGDLGVTDFMHEPTDNGKQPITPEVIAYIKAHHITFVPTIANGESGYYYVEHPQVLAMGPKFDGFYARGRARLTDPEYIKTTRESPDLATRKERIKAMLPFVKLMHDNGIRVITGTDGGAEASQTTPIGHSTHRELQLFVEAGVPPLAAIRDATLDAARVLERTETPSYGAVQAGKAADLVLLDADPTADIYNVDKINRVMRAGKWVD
jgi:imidazolonepropionase-like amidohydrolase